MVSEVCVTFGERKRLGLNRRLWAPREERDRQNKPYRSRSDMNENLIIVPPSSRPNWFHGSSECPDLLMTSLTRRYVLSLRGRPGGHESPSLVLNPTSITSSDLRKVSELGPQILSGTCFCTVTTYKGSQINTVLVSLIPVLCPLAPRVQTFPLHQSLYVKHRTTRTVNLCLLPLDLLLLYHKSRISFPHRSFREPKSPDK